MQGGGGGSAAAAPAGEAAGPAPAVEHRPTELGSVGLLPEPAADVAPTAEDGAPPAGAAAAAPTAEGEQAATDAGAAAAPAPQPAVQEKTGAGQRRRESCMAPMTAATAAWQAAPRSLRSRRPPTSLRLCPLVPPPPPPRQAPTPARQVCVYRNETLAIPSTEAQDLDVVWDLRSSECPPPAVPAVRAVPVGMWCGT